ncbi:hypothetical protein NC651_004072 [Populus alba x Populus x berolinensis]|nr:hypothetical protein NC651_004072 [Populus alba x Populus x berolinensis]
MSLCNVFEEEGPDDVANTLRILVATDCHLGDMEKDEIRRHDSFQAFEETYSTAEQKKVFEEENPWETCQGMMLQIRFEYLLQRIVI